MPIFRPQDSTFKIVLLNNVIVLCNTAGKSQNLPVSDVKLSTGTSQTPFRNIGDRSNTISLSGPALIQSSGFVGDGIGDGIGILTEYSQCINLGVGSMRVADVPSLALALMFNEDTNDFNTKIHKDWTTASQFQNPVIEKVSLTLNESGLNCTMSMKGNTSVSNEGYMNLDYTSSVNSQDTQCKIIQAMRTASFYDFGVNLEHRSTGNQIGIINAFKSFDVSITYDWKPFEYIGKPQTELYIFNGGSIKWNFEANYKFMSTSINIESGAATWTPLNLDYTTNSQKTGVFNSRLISDLNSVYITACDNIGQTNSFSSIDTTTFKGKLTRLMNNCLHQVVIPDFGGQTSHIRYSSPKDGARLTTNVAIDHKFPISTIKVSGERILT